LTLNTPILKMRFACTTQFDITATGVTGHFKSARVPFKDRTGKWVTDITDWNRARNQQRNWETLMQLISLYTQPLRVSPVRVTGRRWQFDFDTDQEDVFGLDNDPVGRLKQSCNGVPVINYVEQELTTLLRPDVNIWFEPSDHK